MNYKNHTQCRVCNSDKLTPYLDLGMMPLSNNLANSALDPIHDQRYPLKVLLCENCGLSQLSIVIPPEEMFSHYVYRSSISKGYLDHCHQMAVDLQQRYNLNINSFHIDIAGNDGALLSQFKKFLGHQVLNVDPAKNLAEICEATGIRTVTKFWGEDVAEIINAGYGQADLITATNVFAHVDDVRGFIQAAKNVMRPNGVLVLEFPYLIDFIENREFDTVYFEHLSYFSIHPLDIICTELDLEIMHISKHEIHGGTVRVEIMHKTDFRRRDYTVSSAIRYERENYSHLGRYKLFADNVQCSITAFREGIMRLNNVAGFAASAKGNTLLNCAGITPRHMRYIVDETPEKMNKFSPGTRIPIVSLINLVGTPPDYLVILSWNFAKEIMRKCREIGYKGKFIIPIPEFEIID